MWEALFKIAKLADYIHMEIYHLILVHLGLENILMTLVLAGKAFQNLKLKIAKPKLKKTRSQDCLH